MSVPTPPPPISEVLHLLLDLVLKFRLVIIAFWKFLCVCDVFVHVRVCVYACVCAYAYVCSI